MPSPTSVTMPTSALRTGMSKSLIRCLIRLLISSVRIPTSPPPTSAGQLPAKPGQLAAHAAVGETVSDQHGRSPHQGRLYGVMDADAATQAFAQGLFIAVARLIVELDRGGECDVDGTSRLVAQAVELATNVGDQPRPLALDQESEQVARALRQVAREALGQLQPAAARAGRVGA